MYEQGTRTAWSQPPRISRKHLLNRSKVEYCDFNCNHYIGCAHACRYPCYARVISKMNYIEWVNVKVVDNALELAAQEIKKLPCGARIMVSSMTDPYQPIEKEEKLTRNLIPTLASREDVKVIIITKSKMVMRDFGLIKTYPNISLAMTITALEDLPGIEPCGELGNAARIQCLREAYAQGIYTIASIEPWIPGKTKPLVIVNKLYPFVNEFIIGSLNWHYKKDSAEERAAVREYEMWLPTVVQFLRDHMIKCTIKKELQNKIQARDEIVCHG